MKSLNRILTDEDREYFKLAIELMWKHCPETMSRKIPDANVQQAFVFDTVTSLYKAGSKILSVGCFEDTAYETLTKIGIDVVGIDPDVNVDLRTFLQSTNEQFDIIFATSVLEHVPDDVGFLADMCTLLSKGGFGILTMDFKDDYKSGDSVPYTDVRFYTKNDLEVRLKAVLDAFGCALLEEPNWTGKDRFVYQGHNYSFATFVFKKAQ